MAILSLVYQMNLDAQSIHGLARLLLAEAAARGASTRDVTDRLRTWRRFNSRQDAYYAMLLGAMEAPPVGPAPISADMQEAVEGLLAASGKRGTLAGPVVVVCESRLFRPEIGTAAEQVVLRLVAALEALGASVWVVRLPRRSAGYAHG